MQNNISIFESNNGKWSFVIQNNNMLLQTLNGHVAMEYLFYLFKRGAFKSVLGAEVASPNILNMAFCCVSAHCLFINTLVPLPKIQVLRFFWGKSQIGTWRLYFILSVVTACCHDPENLSRTDRFSGSAPLQTVN